MKIVLKRPIKVGEKGEVTELVLRERICAGDYRGLKIGGLVSAVRDWEIDDVLRIAGRLAGQPDLVMNDLGEEDLGEVINAIVSFRQASPRTSTTESP